MSLNKRIEKLEANAPQPSPLRWNLSGVSTADLILMRDLLRTDTAAAKGMQDRLAEEGMIFAEVAG